MEVWLHKRCNWHNHPRELELQDWVIIEVSRPFGILGHIQGDFCQYFFCLDDGIVFDCWDETFIHISQASLKAKITKVLQWTGNIYKKFKFCKIPYMWVPQFQTCVLILEFWKPIVLLILLRFCLKISALYSTWTYIYTWGKWGIANDDSILLSWRDSDHRCYREND